MHETVSQEHAPPNERGASVMNYTWSDMFPSVLLLRSMLRDIVIYAELTRYAR